MNSGDSGSPRPLSHAVIRDAITRSTDALIIATKQREEWRARLADSEGFPRAQAFIEDTIADFQRTIDVYLRAGESFERDLREVLAIGIPEAQRSLDAAREHIAPAMAAHRDGELAVIEDLMSRYAEFVEACRRARVGGGR